MNYKEEIKKAIETATNNLKPDRKLRDEANEKFKQRESEELIPVKKLIEAYLDDTLKDKNGISIKIGYIISDGKYNYKVINRGMQFMFGEPLFNPSVEVKKYDINTKTIIGKKINDLSGWELLEFVFITEEI